MAETQTTENTEVVPVTEEEEVEAAGESVGYYIPEGLPKHFVSERDGKAVVSFQGLIHMLHLATLGEFSCINDPVQQGNAENGRETIVRCTLKGMRRLSGSDEKVPFEVVCYGDASPENVTRMIAVHIRRMAETRAMARAMRVATNVGLTAAEELGGNTGGGTNRNRGRGNYEPREAVPERVVRTPPRAQTAEEAPPIAMDEGPGEKVVQPVDTIIVGNKKYTRAQVVAAMRKRIEEANALGIKDYKRVGEEDALSDIVALSQSLRKRIEEAAAKNEEKPTE